MQRQCRHFRQRETPNRHLPPRPQPRRHSPAMLCHRVYIRPLPAPQLRSFHHSHSSLACCAFSPHRFTAPPPTTNPSSPPPHNPRRHPPSLSSPPTRSPPPPRRLLPVGPPPAPPRTFPKPPRRHLSLTPSLLSRQPLPSFAPHPSPVSPCIMPFLIALSHSASRWAFIIRYTSLRLSFFCSSRAVFHLVYMKQLSAFHQCPRLCSYLPQAHRYLSVCLPFAVATCDTQPCTFDFFFRPSHFSKSRKQTTATTTTKSRTQYSRGTALLLNFLNLLITYQKILDYKTET